MVTNYYSIFMIVTIRFESTTINVAIFYIDLFLSDFQTFRLNRIANVIKIRLWQLSDINKTFYLLQIPILVTQFNDRFRSMSASTKTKNRPSIT